MPADAQAAGLPGAPPGGGMVGAGGFGPNGAFSLEDSNTLARWARGDLELGPSPAAGTSAAAPAGTSAAAPSDGRKSVVPPIPQGYRPLYDPYALEQDIATKSWLGVPTADEEDIAKHLRAGDMEYWNPQTNDRRWLPMPGGAKDAGAQVEAGGAAAKESALQPYKQVTIKRTNPVTGQPEELMMAGDDAATYLHGGGPGTGGGAPGTQPPGAAAPIAAPGLGDVSKQMGDMLEKSRAAQNGLDEAKQLQATLEQIGNVGPGTDWAGKISAILGRAGYSQAELTAAGLPNASDVYAAQKLSTDLLLNRAKESFTKVTNMDLGTVRGATPSAEMPLGASRELLGNVVIPQLWRETRRYQDLAQNPAVWQSPAGFHQAYAAWDVNNPLSNFRTGPPAPGTGQAAPAAGAPTLRWDPQQGKLVPMGR
jgi:hypothetical protein